MSPTEIADLHQTIGHLRQCVGALRSNYGDVNAVRRIAIDIERLELDAGELEQALPPAKVKRPTDVIYVPDSRSDEAAWMGAQDEGLGFHSRERTK